MPKKKKEVDEGVLRRKKFKPKESLATIRKMKGSQVRVTVNGVKKIMSKHQALYDAGDPATVKKTDAIWKKRKAKAKKKK